MCRRLCYDACVNTGIVTGWGGARLGRMDMIRILVVEDEQAISSLIALSLNRLHHATLPYRKRKAPGQRQ